MESKILLIKSSTNCNRIEALRREIQTLTSIPENAQILLTGKGAQLKPDMMANAIQLEIQRKSDSNSALVFLNISNL